MSANNYLVPGLPSPKYNYEYSFHNNNGRHGIVEVVWLTDSLKTVGFWDQCGVWVDKEWTGAIPKQCLIMTGRSNKNG